MHSEYCITKKSYQKGRIEEYKHIRIAKNTDPTPYKTKKPHKAITLAE